MTDPRENFAEDKSSDSFQCIACYFLFIIRCSTLLLWGQHSEIHR